MQLKPFQLFFLFKRTIGLWNAFSLLRFFVIIVVCVCVPCTRTMGGGLCSCVSYLIDYISLSSCVVCLFFLYCVLYMFTQESFLCFLCVFFFSGWTSKRGELLVSIFKMLSFSLRRLLEMLYFYLQLLKLIGYR